MRSASFRLCFIGNMLGETAGYVTTQGQILGELFASEGYEIETVSSRINRVARFVDIVTTLVWKRGNIDAVILETYSGLYFLIPDVVGRICELLGLPLVAVLHGGQIPEFVRRFPRWTRRVLRRADALVAPSHFMAKEMGTFGYEVRVIPNVIDLDLYPYRERRKILPNLIWMRSFHQIYNPEMAVEVLVRLLESEPTATLTMAGPDKGSENGVKSLAEEKGVSGAVRFVGFLDQDAKIKEMSTADIYLNTNRVDNMPVSVIEARAFGLPVIATRVGGLPFLIEDSKNGLLVPNEDVDAMVSQIKRLLSDPDLTLKISSNGRALAELSAWRSVRGEWERLFDDLLPLSPGIARMPVQPSA